MKRVSNSNAGIATNRATDTHDNGKVQVIYNGRPYRITQTAPVRSKSLVPTTSPMKVKSSLWRAAKDLSVHRLRKRYLGLENLLDI
jgi:hypothetical protein